MSLPALPLFVRLHGRPVILLGSGEAAAAKRRDPVMDWLNIVRGA